MDVATQISGNIQPGNTALLALKDMLTRIGISVTHSLADESLFYEPDTSEAWRQYQHELAFYNSIANSAFHIVYNDGAIDEKIGTQILYAMLKGRPIIMSCAPRFAPDLSPYMHQLIREHIPQFHSINLPELEPAELSSLLEKLEATDYNLSATEKILIKMRVNNRLRSLLAAAEKQRLEEAETLSRPIEEV